MPVNNFKYQSQKLLDCVHSFSHKDKKEEIFLDGENLSFKDMNHIFENETKVSLTQDQKILARIKHCYEHMIKQVENGVPVYGVNTGYGGQASLVVNEGTKEQRLAMAQKISDSIVHVDVSTGPVVPKAITRLAIAIRANMLMKGVSAVCPEDIYKFCELINNDLIPKVGCYGGLGASGDLPQNGRVLSVLRQLPGTKIWSETGFIDASQALKSKGFKPLILAPKAGLGLVNGDNFSTAAAFHLTRETLFALLTQAVAGAMMFEMTLATNRSLHPLIYKIRKHQGQEEVASLYLNLIQDSQYIRNEMKELLPSVDGRKVQDVYSIRCLSQFFGVSWERVKWAMDTVEINANSASDNPLWTTDDTRLEGEKPGQWVSGGNFIAEYMVEVMDALRKTITQIVKVNDRHMSKLIDPHENNGLTPNLSYKDAISQCTFKGIQAQAGMFEVYSTFLSMPISTLFGVHEQNNQDITSHAMTSGLIGRENLQVCWLSLAQLMIALAQAVDLREGSSKLSSKTKKIYDFVRQDIEFAKTEKPLGPEIELIASKLQTIEFRNLLVEEVLS